MEQKAVKMSMTAQAQSGRDEHAREYAYSVCTAEQYIQVRRRSCRPKGQSQRCTRCTEPAALIAVSIFLQNNRA